MAQFVAQPPKVPKVIPLQAVLYARRERPDVWPNLQKALAAGDIVIGTPTTKEEFYKGPGAERAGHKYIRRVYTGDPRNPWRYEYAQQLTLPLGDRQPADPADDEHRPAPPEQPKQLPLFTIPQPQRPERAARPTSSAGPRPLQLVAQPNQGVLDLGPGAAPPKDTPPAPPPAAAPAPVVADDRFVLGSYVSKRGNLKRVAKFTRRVERDEWGVLAALAREHGGSYVREAGGFVFRDDAGYDTFMAALASHGAAAPVPPEHAVEVAPAAPAAPVSTPVEPPPAPPPARQRVSEPGWDRMPEKERIGRQAKARGWTGEIAAEGGTLRSPDGKLAVTVARLDNGKWSVAKEYEGRARRLEGPTGEQREIRDSNGELVTTVAEYGTEYSTLAAASEVASEAMRVETSHPDATKIIEAYRESDKSWYAGLAAGHALLALKRGEHAYVNGRPVKIDGSVDPDAVTSRPLGVHVKKRLEEHFKDQHGQTEYYGAGEPQDAVTMWRQKVDGLKLVRDETMDQRKTSPAWAAAGAKLDQAIADLERQQPLFATIHEVTGGKRFAASSTHTAGDEVATALRLSDDEKATRAVSEPGWDRMPEKEPAEVTQSAPSGVVRWRKPTSQEVEDARAELRKILPGISAKVDPSGKLLLQRSDPPIKGDDAKALLRFVKDSGWVTVHPDGTSADDTWQRSVDAGLSITGLRIVKKVSEPGWDRMPGLEPAPSPAPTPGQRWRRPGTDVHADVLSVDAAAGVAKVRMSAGTVTDMPLSRLQNWNLDPEPAPPAPPPAPTVTRETLLADVRAELLGSAELRQAAAVNSLDNFALFAPKRIEQAIVARIEQAIAGGGAAAVNELLGDKAGMKRLATELYQALRPGPAEATPAAASTTVRRMAGAVGLTPGERKKANVRALELVEAAKTRKLTDAELDDVARYSGKGGIGSSLNQYFTRPDVAAAIWQRAAQLSGGPVKTALEPACGSGVFLATAPDGVRVTGVEIDPEVAGVAAVLHGDRHEVIASSLEEYAVRHEGVSTVDVVITNAPFVTRTGGGAKLHKPDMADADQYFLDTAIDQVKDGGVVAMIVHNSVMTGGRAADFRARLAARAEVVDAYRLPGESFKHAGTEVTTDVIFLRKRPGAVGAALLAGGEDLQRKVGVYDDAFVRGDWYESRPGRVLGTTVKDWRGNDAVTGSAEAVAGAIGSAAPGDSGPAGKAVTLDEIKTATGQDEAQLRAVERAAAAATATPTVGASKVVNGVTYILTGDPPRWKRADEIDDVAAVIGTTPSEAVTEAQSLAEALADLRAALDAGDYYKARHLRRSTADRVRAWVEAHGQPAEHAQLVKLAKADRSLMLVLGAVHGDGTLSDMLLRDPVSTGATGKGIDRADLRAVAEHVAAGADGYVSIADVARLWTGAAGHSEAEIRAKVAALEQFAVEAGGELRHLEDYLTGDVFGKRDALANATDPKQVWQREQLDQRIRARWRTLDDVEVQLRSGWIPPGVLGAFLTSEAGQKLTSWQYNEDKRVTIEFEDSWYTMTTHEHGKTRHDSGDDSEIVRYLNRSRLSQREREKIEDIEAAFSEWVKGSAWRDELEDIYNRRFFGDVRKEYSGAQLDLPGLSDAIKPHDYQNAAVRWAADQGTGVIALDVGLGKTLTGILLARQLKAQGKAKRPVIVVPKSVATNWQREIERITPGARVLIIGETSVEVASGKNKGKRVSRADDADERNRKLALAQQNDYDAIIITRPAFERIPLRPETIERFEDDDFWQERAKQIESATGKTMATTEKKREKVKAAYEAAAAARKFDHEKALVYWEDLGADFLMADEAHGYKNLYEARQRFGKSPKFLGGSGTSKQSKDMQHKARVVREKTKAGGVYFLTATPTKNSPLEVYSMLAHLVPEEWERRGIRNAEEFIDRYCTLENRMVLDADGKVEEALAVTGFRNLTELHDLMDRYLLQRNATDVGLKIPDSKQVTEMVDMHPAQREAYDRIRAEAEKARNSKDESEAKGAMFRSLDQMKKAATDLELLDPDRYAGWHTKSPKYKRAVEKIVEGAKSGGQVVFVDSIASHERLKSMLVAAGMKTEEIAIINAQVAPDSEQRYEIGEAFNRGDVKVVIGNTATMGEGVNLQRKTTDIHHLDQPWDPGSMQQRNGRGVRQGNANANVTVHTYLCKRSFDGFRHGTLEGKRGWLEKLRSGADTIANDAADSDLSADDILVMLADDPDAAREEINKKKAEKVEEWKVKKRAEVMARVGQLLAMRERLRGLAHDAPAAELLRNKIAALSKRLKADENLPATAHDLIDRERVRAVVDPATGKAFVVGAIVTRDTSRYVVKNVDPGRGKVELQYSGEYASSYSNAHWSDVASAGQAYETTELTDADAFNSALDKIATGTGRQFRPWEDLATFRPELVTENSEAVSAALGQAFRASKSQHDKAPMVAPDGTVHIVKPAEAKQRQDLRMLLPVGADWTRLVDAATEASRPERARNIRWADSLGYMNDVIGAAGWNYGEKVKNDLIAAVKRRLA